MLVMSICHSLKIKAKVKTLSKGKVKTLSKSKISSCKFTENYFLSEIFLTATLMFTSATVQTMKFFIKNLFSKCDQIRSFVWIWSYLLKNHIYFIENLILCAVCFIKSRNDWLVVHDENVIKLQPTQTAKGC